MADEVVRPYRVEQPPTDGIQAVVSRWKAEGVVDVPQVAELDQHQAEGRLVLRCRGGVIPQGAQEGLARTDRRWVIRVRHAPLQVK